MFCTNCGKQIPDKSTFCQYCGSTIRNFTPLVEKNDISPVANTNEVIQNSISKRRNFKEKISNLFDFSKKKFFFESLLIYIFLVILGYLFVGFSDSLLNGYDEDLFVYIQNTAIVFIAILVISYVKGLKWGSWFWAFVGGAVTYLLGLFIGFIVIFIPLMKKKPSFNILDDPIKKKFVYKILKKAIFFYLLGTLITIISDILAIGGWIYVFYGPVIYGLYLVIKVVYYCVNIKALGQQINKLPVKNN